MSSLLRTRSLLIPLVLLFAVFCVPTTHAQTQPGPPNPTVPDASAPFGSAAPDKPDALMTAKMVRERNEDRQKQIIDETNHLLDLAKQLKDAVDKSDKDQLSLQVLHKAEEIEKLARDVKNKMRDGTPEPTPPS